MSFKDQVRCLLAIIVLSVGLKGIFFENVWGDYLAVWAVLTFAMLLELAYAGWKLFHSRGLLERSVALAQQVIDLRAEVDRLQQEAVTAAEETANALVVQEQKISKQVEAVWEIRLRELDQEWRQRFQQADLAGAFMVLAWRWHKAIRPRAKPIIVNGKTMTAADWWRQLREVAIKRWPRKNWTDADLAEAAKQAALLASAEAWRHVCSSEFGFRGLVV